MKVKKAVSPKVTAEEIDTMNISVDGYKYTVSLYDDGSLDTCVKVSRLGRSYVARFCSLDGIIDRQPDGSILPRDFKTLAKLAIEEFESDSDGEEFFAAFGTDGYASTVSHAEGK